MLREKAGGALGRAVKKSKEKETEGLRMAGRMSALALQSALQSGREHKRRNFPPDCVSLLKS